MSQLQFHDYNREFGNEYFQVESVSIMQNPQIAIADPYYYPGPRYVDAECFCEATIKFRDAPTLYAMLEYMKTYNRDTEYQQKDIYKYENEISNIKDELADTLDMFKPVWLKINPKYKLKHKVNSFKL